MIYRKSTAVRPWLALLAALAFGCAGTGPRVLEVSHDIHRRLVDDSEAAIFTRDRVTHFNVTPKVLAAKKQWEEFYVRWTPLRVGLVKFEYRQVNDPNVVHEQTCTPDRQASAQFFIRGETFAQGGPVSAWRVSLWSNNALLAEQKSSLW